MQADLVSCCYVLLYMYCLDQPISTGTTTVSLTTITDTATTQVKDTVDHDSVRYQISEHADMWIRGKVNNIIILVMYVALALEYNILTF